MRSIEWTGTSLRLLDQRRLPQETVWETYDDAESVADAIRSMKVRGAPAIGASAAFGLAAEARRLSSLDSSAYIEHLEQAIQTLTQSRPTAVNLGWAMDRMRPLLNQAFTTNDELVQRLTEEAVRIAAMDVDTNRAIGAHGATLFSKESAILTHCNTGSLATVEYGTALGVIRSLHHEGKLTHVYVDETRPYLQGARLTAYELVQEGIPHTVITDSMAGHLMKSGMVDGVLVGADRITKNGDTANKIGTYSLAVLCAYHRIPFYVAAPTSTFDLTLETGDSIPIEQRAGDEVLVIGGQRMAPNETTALHPAFDVTPHDLITAIITEYGVIQSPTTSSILRLFEKERLQ